MKRPSNFPPLLFALLLVAACSNTGEKEDAGSDDVYDSSVLPRDAGGNSMDANVARDGGSDSGRDSGSSMDAAVVQTDAGGAADDAGAASSDAGGGSIDTGITSDAATTDAARTDAATTDAATTIDAGGGMPDSGQVACSAAPSVGKLGFETVVSGLSRLVFAAQAPGTNDWYLVQQTGEIFLRAAGATTNTMILDLDIAGLGGGGDERGLLGLAFAPDFATSGLFYVMLTTPSTNVDEVRQYRRMGATSTLTETLLTLPASQSNHNGGTVVMRDGLLYVGTGDGGGGCNSAKPGAPQQLTVDPNSWFGKILRLDPSKKASGFAADGNPFPQSPLVYHYGLRNPFRFGFDRATGDMYIGDVGDTSYEEINFAKAGTKGLNFGWPAFESSDSTCNRTLPAGTPAQPTKPIFAADRRSGCSGRYCDWRSSIGGVVYRGQAVPKLQGVHLSGDYQGQRMVALYQCDATTSPITQIRKQCDPNAPNDACFQGNTFSVLTAIVEDNAGELYFVANFDRLLKVVAVP